MMKTADATKEVGFEVGVKKTLAIPFEQAWDFLFSAPATRIWMGQVDQDFFLGHDIFNSEGVFMYFTTFKENSHFRMRWRRADWQDESILEIRIAEKASQTSFSIHQEKLTDALQRIEMQLHWLDVLKRLEVLLK